MLLTVISTISTNVPHGIYVWPMLCPRISGAYFLNRLCRFSCICYAPGFWGRSFVNRLCPRICDSVIYFIYQMAIHNANKLLNLTNQTKLTLINRSTNPNQHSNRNIFTRISLTPIKRLYCIIRGGA